MYNLLLWTSPTSHSLYCILYLKCLFAIKYVSSSINPLGTRSSTYSLSLTHSKSRSLFFPLSPASSLAHVCTLLLNVPWQSKCWHQHLFPEGHPNLTHSTITLLHVCAETHTQNLLASPVRFGCYLFLQCVVKMHRVHALLHNIHLSYYVFSALIDGCHALFMQATSRTHESRVFVCMYH